MGCTSTPHHLRHQTRKGLTPEHRTEDDRLHSRSWGRFREELHANLWHGPSCAAFWFHRIVSSGCIREAQRQFESGGNRKSPLHASCDSLSADMNKAHTRSVCRIQTTSQTEFEGDLSPLPYLRQHTNMCTVGYKND